MRGAGCTYNDILDRKLDARGRAHPQSPAAVGPGHGSRGRCVPCRPGARRPRRALVLQPVLDLAWRRLARRRCDLSRDEARDVLAAGRARPRLLLGRADGLERDLRRASRWPRSCSTFPPSHGRSATTRSTRCRTRATTRSSAFARPPGCSGRAPRLGVGLFYAASAALALAAIEVAGGGGIALIGWLALCGASRLAGFANRRRRPAHGAEALSLQSRRRPHPVRRDRVARVGGVGPTRAGTRIRPLGQFPPSSGQHNQANPSKIAWIYLVYSSESGLFNGLQREK